MEQQSNRYGKVHYKGIAELDLKALNDSRRISGYASIFGVKDHGGDLIHQGAFARSIAQRGPQSSKNAKIVLLNQHDMRQPLGRVTKLVEDEKGLYFEADIDAIPAGDALITQLKSGTINQFSIGFKYIKDATSFDHTTNTYHIKDVDLYEISPVTFGANGETKFLGFKSELSEAEALEELDNALKSLDMQDEFTIRQLIEKCYHATPADEVKHEIKDDTEKLDIKALFSQINLI